MAAFPTYTIEDLAEFAGEDESAYTNTGFAAMALRQALRLFKTGTCLKDWPDDPDAAELAEFAVKDMANAIYWVQPFQKVLRNPFNSETIGSYSYSKLSGAVAAGLPTGVSWFDIAVGQIGICDFNPSGTPLHGGWNVMEERKTASGGYGVFLGPEDQNPDSWGPNTRMAEGDVY